MNECLHQHTDEVLADLKTRWVGAQAVHSRQGEPPKVLNDA